MRKRSVLLTVFMMTVFVSCQDSSRESGNLPYSQDELEFLMRYTQKFESKFGEVNTSHKWGFGLQPIAGAEKGSRVAVVNSNEWVSVYHFDVPGGLSDDQNLPWGWAHGDVTNYERAYVYWWFSTHRWPVTTEVNWSDYFIQYVWGQPEHSDLNGDGTRYNDGIPDYGMDNVKAILPGKESANPASNITSENANTHIFSDLLSDYEHVSDFNAGGRAREQVMYEANSSTKDFLYESSFGSEFHNNWTLQYINGNYYLAFDYWHEKKDANGNIVYDNCNPVPADGYYNDWILKLGSGTHTVDNYTRRVMCEDLGNTYDWDFNDVVFDVTTFMENQEYYAMITLQAAGGTKPIFVGDFEHEAHAMFGVPYTQPVNVAAGVMRPAVVWRLKLTENQLETIDGVVYAKTESIPIYVEVEGIEAGEAVPYEIQNEKGLAPQKICCPVNTYWLKEMTGIEKGHSRFTDWAKGGSKATDETIPVDDEFFVTTTNGTPNFSYLYADLGKPYAVTYAPGKENGWQQTTFTPWKELWEGRDKTDTQFTQDWTYTKSWEEVQENGVVRHAPKETYSRNFIQEAPYIFSGAGTDDPIALSPDKMQTIINNATTYSEFYNGVVWQPSNGNQ